MRPLVFSGSRCTGVPSMFTWPCLFFRSVFLWYEHTVGHCSIIHIHCTSSEVSFLLLSKVLVFLESKKEKSHRENFCQWPSQAGFSFSCFRTQQQRDSGDGARDVSVVLLKCSHVCSYHHFHWSVTQHSTSLLPYLFHALCLVFN